MNDLLLGELNQLGGIIIVDSSFCITAWNTMAQQLLNKLCLLKRGEKIFAVLPALNPYFSNNISYYRAISLMISETAKPIYVAYSVQPSGGILFTLHETLPPTGFHSCEWLIAGIAQELRSPLTAIKTATGLISRIEPVSTAWLEVESEVNQQVWRVDQVIEYLAVLGHRDQYSSEETTDLSSILSPIIEEFGETHTISYYREQQDTVVGNAASLYYAFRELIKNAAEASSNRASITIITSSTEEEVIISIINYGEPILQEFTSVVFEPFFTTKPDQTGMGLTIARQLIHNCGGTICLYGSDEETVVKVYLRRG